MSHRNQCCVCVYCGEQRKLTADHVPPKLLFAQPYPTNLITVPACRSCNASFQKDDEYTRTVISLDVRASKNLDVQLKLPAILRSLKKPNARAFAEYLASQTAASAVVAPDGAPMGQIVNVDRARVNATGARIIRGLYFVEMGRPLTPNAVMRVEARGGPLRPDEADARTIAHAYCKFSEHRDGAIGTAFSYAAGFGDGMSVWIMLLYDYFLWVGTVDARSAPDGGLGLHDAAVTLKKAETGKNSVRNS
jgi:hypothetical protein